jgi:hypothetical protein
LGGVDAGGQGVVGAALGVWERLIRCAFSMQSGGLLRLLRRRAVSV